MRQPDIYPQAENATLEEPGVAMEAAPNKRSYIRLNAIRCLLLGMGRKTVRLTFARTDRMIRLWFHSFSQGGIDALITKPRSGRPRKVKLHRVHDLLVPVLEDLRRRARSMGRASNSTAMIGHIINCDQPVPLGRNNIGNLLLKFIVPLRSDQALAALYGEHNLNVDLSVGVGRSLKMPLLAELGNP